MALARIARWSIGHDHIAATIVVGGAAVVMLATRSPTESAAPVLALDRTAQQEPQGELLELEPLPTDEPGAEADEQLPASFEPEVVTAAIAEEPIDDAIEEPIEEPIEEFPIAEAAAEVTTGEAPAAPILVATPAESTYPNGRWVLFDRFGQPIDAIVQPWCQAMTGECPEYGPIAPSCVWIEYLGQDRVRAPFRLSDGAPEVCYDPTGLDRGHWTPLPPYLSSALAYDAPYSLALVYE